MPRARIGPRQSSFVEDGPDNDDDPQGSFSCRVAAPHWMKMWEPLSERRLVVSTDTLRSPLRTAAPTFSPIFKGTHND